MTVSVSSIVQLCHHRMPLGWLNGLLLMKSCCLSHIASLSSICLSIASKRIYSMIFPIQMRLKCLWLLGLFFLFLKMGLHLSTMTIWQSNIIEVAWLLQQTILSRLWDESQLDLQTYGWSSSSCGHKPHLSLQREGHCSLSPHLTNHPLERCMKSSCQ